VQENKKNRSRSPRRAKKRDVLEQSSEDSTPAEVNVKEPTNVTWDADVLLELFSVEKPKNWEELSNPKTNKEEKLKPPVDEDGTWDDDALLELFSIEKQEISEEVSIPKKREEKPKQPVATYDAESSSSYGDAEAVHKLYVRLAALDSSKDNSKSKKKEDKLKQASSDDDKEAVQKLFGRPAGLDDSDDDSDEDEGDDDETINRLTALMTRSMHATKQRREEALQKKQQAEAVEKKRKEKETKRKRKEEKAAERKRNEKEEVEKKRREEKRDAEKKKDCISHVEKTMYEMVENNNEDEGGSSSSPNQKQPQPKPVNKNPDTKIRPMEAWELREMLKLKGPPRRNPRIKDSPVFREDNGPEISSMFRAFPEPTVDSIKVTKRWDGKDALIPQDQYEQIQQDSTERKGFPCQVYAG
jgi:hypothetical protein